MRGGGKNARDDRLRKRGSIPPSKENSVHKSSGVKDFKDLGIQNGLCIMQCNVSVGGRGQGMRLGWRPGPFPIIVKTLAFIHGLSKQCTAVVSGEIKSGPWMCADVLGVGTSCYIIVSIVRSSRFATSHPHTHVHYLVG